MPSRIGVITVQILEREIKRLEKRVVVLEKQLQKKDAELQAAQKSSARAAGKLRPPQMTALHERKIAGLERQIDALRKEKAEDAAIIDEQRDSITVLRTEARKRVPREILKDALPLSNISPMAQSAISAILESREPFEKQMVALLKAYDVAVRAARRNILSKQNANSPEY